MSEFIIVPSEILAVVTALSASFAVLIPKSFTLNGLVVVPNPSIVFMSAIAPNVAESIHATAPAESVTKTELAAPEAIFEGVTAPAASLDVVTFKFEIFEVTTALSANLEVVTCKSDSFAVVTALSASFEVVTALAVSIGFEAVEPTPPKSPASCIFPFMVEVASGVALVTCVST